MSLDPKIWTNTLPNSNIECNEEKYKIDNEKWAGSLPKINKNNQIKKYSLITTLFVVGLIFVSIIKNETRNLQKEINKLQASINILKFDLHQTALDHEVISSPENISLLAKEYLEIELTPYKKSQIKQLSKKEKILIKSQNSKIKKDLKQIAKENKNKMKLIVAKKIETKRTELMKLQEFYYKPEEIPKELKVQVAKKIETKKSEIQELKKIYSEPKSIFTSKRMQRWAGLQVVKVFLGIPIVPGK